MQIGYLRPLILTLALLSPQALCAPPPSGKTTTLADGSSMQYGALSSGVKWQSSGVLTKGCTFTTTIKDCYGMSLTADPSRQLDPGFPNSPRQRIEFRVQSQQPPPANSKAPIKGKLYTWKHYLAPTDGQTSSHFFHLMQVYDESAGGPSITLDAVKGALAVNDYVRKGCGGGGCPATGIEHYVGRTTLHRLGLVAGPNGTVDYVVTDADTGEYLMQYYAEGFMGKTTNYIKYGIYRAAFAGQTALSAGTGDYTIQDWTPARTPPHKIVGSGRGGGGGGNQDDDQGSGGIFQPDTGKPTPDAGKPTPHTHEHTHDRPTGHANQDGDGSQGITIDLNQLCDAIMPNKREDDDDQIGFPPRPAPTDRIERKRLPLIDVDVSVPLNTLSEDVGGRILPEERN